MTDSSLLAVLMALVPIVCGILARMFEPTESRVQMKVQGWSVSLTATSGGAIKQM